jgi:hypothetical protein
MATTDCCAVRQQRGHEARAGADLEHPFMPLHLRLLQQAGLDLGRQHALAFGQRHLSVDEGQRR